MNHNENIVRLKKALDEASEKNTHFLESIAAKKAAVDSIIAKNSEVNRKIAILTAMDANRSPHAAQSAEMIELNEQSSTIHAQLAVARTELELERTEHDRWTRIFSNAREQLNKEIVIKIIDDAIGAHKDELIAARELAKEISTDNAFFDKAMRVAVSN